jgi:hypothetical protein
MMALAIIASAAQASAFVTKSSNVVHQTTALNAMPPMIIGPMIRKMREDKEKKKMPMISGDEQRGQAPGLRVGGKAWKWPPIWPYDQDFFTPSEDIETPDSSNQLNGMASMLSGMPSIPSPDETEGKEQETLDVVKYWTEEKADVRTELDEEAIEKLKR